MGLWPLHFTTNVGFMTLVSTVIFVVTSLVGSERPDEEMREVTWTPEMATDAFGDDAPIWANIKVWGGLLVIGMAAILIVFW